MLDKMIENVFSDERLLTLYKNLKSEFTDNELRKYECLFIPYVGEDWRKTNKKRILYVGRDPDGNGKENLRKLSDTVKQQSRLEELAGITRVFVQENWAHPGPGKHHSPFRDFLLRVTWGVLAHSPQLPDLEPSKSNAETVFRSIAWTNVFKTAERSNKKNNEYFVDRKMEDFHLRRFNTLPEEINKLEPALIVFTTSWYYDDYLRKVFPSIEFRPLSPELPVKDAALVMGVCDRALVVRCRQPQGWGNQQQESLYRSILNEIRGR
jgi:hypothetical protein